jgi:hypothetical protein
LQVADLAISDHLCAADERTRLPPESSHLKKFSRISVRGALADLAQSRTAQTDEQVSTIVGNRGGERQRKTREAG